MRRDGAPAGGGREGVNHTCFWLFGQARMLLHCFYGANKLANRTLSYARLFFFLAFRHQTTTDRMQAGPTK